MSWSRCCFDVTGFRRPLPREQCPRSTRIVIVTMPRFNKCCGLKKREYQWCFRGLRHGRPSPSSKASNGLLRHEVIALKYATDATAYGPPCRVR